jgi:hypothetical protein
LDEEYPARPETAYSLSKLLGGEMVFLGSVLRVSTGLKYVFSAVLGPEDPAPKGP